MLSGLGGKIMEYDGENRPLSVTYLGKKTCYVYGTDGKRLKMVEGLAPATLCTALPPAANVTTYFGPVEVRNWLGAEQVLTYPWAAIKLTNGVATWLHFDHLGSVRAITDAAGVKVESAIYRPFGEQSEWLLPGNVSPETKGWIGERYDADAGLQYLNARYYDPALGLFLQPDWFEVTKPGVGTNRFSYSFNDPINRLDPNGNQDATDTLSVEEQEKLAELCAKGCISDMSYAEQMSNVCEAGGCAIVATGLTGGLMVLAEGTGMLAAAATATLMVEDIQAVTDGVPAIPGRPGRVTGTGSAVDDVAQGVEAAAQETIVSLTYKPGWTAAQRAAADQKVALLSQTRTVVVDSVERATASASRRYRSSGGSVPVGSDVDHVVDLQLGGADTVANMSPLDSSVNRSLGAQIAHAVRDLDVGTVIDRFLIGD